MNTTVSYKRRHCGYPMNKVPLKDNPHKLKKMKHFAQLIVVMV